jgi:hypothetical protein
MAGKDAALIIQSLSKRWTQTSNPSAGASCIATQALVAGEPTGRINLTTLTATQKNLTAAAVTSTLNVRVASITGTVLSSMEFVTNTGVVEWRNNYYDLPGKAGQSMVIEWGTPNASVIQKMTVCGWTEGMV